MAWHGAGVREGGVRGMARGSGRGGGPVPTHKILPRKNVKKNLRRFAPWEARQSNLGPRPPPMFTLILRGQPGGPLRDIVRDQKKPVDRGTILYV